MSFHQFTRLPSEVRSRIWDIAACEPRLVVVSDFKGKADDPTMEPTSFTPPPAVLHACRESRSTGLKRYTKTLDDGVRYAWVNMDIDTVKMCVCAMSGFLDLDELKHISIVLHKTHGGSFLMDTGFHRFSRLETLEMTYPTVEAELIDTFLDTWSETHTNPNWQGNHQAHGQVEPGLVVKDGSALHPAMGKFLGASGKIAPDTTERVNQFSTR